MQIIDGKTVSQQIKQEILQEVNALASKGVGPMTIVTLLRNTVKSAKFKYELDEIF